MVRGQSACSMLIHADSRVDIIESFLVGSILSKEAGSESQFHRPAIACVLGVGTSLSNLKCQGFGMLSPMCVQQQW